MDSDKLVILFGDSDQVTRLSVLITNKWEISINFRHSFRGCFYRHSTKSKPWRMAPQDAPAALGERGAVGRDGTAEAASSATFLP